MEQQLRLAAGDTVARDLGTDGRTEASSRRRAEALWRALRPRQWLKNLLVVAAPGAAGTLSRPDVLAHVGVAFAVLSLVASATYLVNDVVDAPTDRRHPTKRLRPVAAGDLPPAAALSAAGVLFAGGIGLGTTLGGRFMLVVASYVGVTLAYSAWLKRVEVFDMAAVASCYVLRALAGAAATSVAISPWFLILTSSAAVFVVAGKRAADRSALARHGEARLNGNGSDYPMAYLRYVWMLASGVAVAAYCLWAFDVPHLVDGIAWSQISIVPFALGVMRYSLLIERGRGGQPEEVFLHDRSLQLIAVLWLAIYAMGIYTS
ncbi:MAG TPA: decaprenyl-phosphate phosphoribosyltransferase [Actinomycetota bacterium]